MYSPGLLPPYFVSEAFRRLRLLRRALFNYYYYYEMLLLLKTGNSAFSVPSLILCEVGLYALNVYILFIDIYT